MSNMEAAISIVLTALSIAISGVFDLYGWVMVSAESAPIGLIAFAVATVVNGIAAFSILLWSWLGGGNKPTKIIKLFGFTYLALFVGTSLDVGMISGLEFAAILGVFLAVIFHWYSVLKISQWRQHA